MFVVAPQEIAKMNARQTFAHLAGFDASVMGNYRRSARLPPGRYRLVLMEKTPSSASVTDVQVSARLIDLQ